MVIEKKSVREELLPVDEERALQEEQFLNDAGKVLRRARLAKKISLEDVSNKLCIRKAYLKAIEAGDFEALPQLSFSSGFVRSYSKFLNLDDTGDLVETFRTEYLKDPAVEAPGINSDALAQISTSEKQEGGDYLWGTVLVVIGLVFIWVFFKIEQVSGLFD